jgi:hypothetical protein
MNEPGGAVQGVTRFCVQSRKEPRRTMAKDLTEAAGGQARKITTGVRKQALTRRVTIRSIVADREFAPGLAEVRRGLPFNVDNDDWNYERGRCFGFIAPLDMPLRIGRKLNPKALKLAEAAFTRKVLI